MTAPSGEEAARPRRGWSWQGVALACATAALGVALVVVTPYVVPPAYLRVFGMTARGEVTATRESIELRAGGEWRHVFEVSYRFWPRDNQQAETGLQGTDAALFARLKPGSPVQVRYSRQAWVRSWLPGVGATLAETSWLARLAEDSRDSRMVSEWLAIGAVALAWLAAFATGRRWVAFVAGIGAATLLSSILPFGWLVLSLMFWMWRRSPGRGFGWSLAATFVLSAAVIAWRIPWPTPVAPGPLRETHATVRMERLVDHIWKPHQRASGQDLRQPFHLVDLEFTPEGAAAPVHALDRVDANSVPGLRAGASVPIVYPVSDPRTARIAGAARTYARGALFYVMGLNYGLAVLLALVVSLLAFLGHRVRSSPLGTIVNPGQRIEVTRKLAGLAQTDERRKAVENILKESR